MEIKFVKDELDEEQLKNRQRLPLTGLNIYFSSIESNIAFKEELLKSPKDLDDARHLRIIYEGKINEDKISEIKKKSKKIRMRRWEINHILNKLKDGQDMLEKNLTKGKQN